MKKKTILKIGQKSNNNLIYKCSVCKKLQVIIKNEKAPPCGVCRNNDVKGQYWIATDKEVLLLSKNIKKQIESYKTYTDRISDTITDFCGDIYFVYIHLVWFGAWLVYNLVSKNPFDPYPFGLLTLIVSLEAIVLAAFILISQNRQGEIMDMRSELDFQIDLKSEKNSALTLELLNKIYSELKKDKKEK